MLGLRTSEGVPTSPKGPAIAFRAEVEKTKVEVHVASTDGLGSAWVPAGSFTLKIDPASGEPADKKLNRQATELADSMAAGLLGKLVRCQLSKGERVKGKKTYKIRIDNGSSLILNGLALGGSDDPAKVVPSILAGFCLPPRKSLTVPVAADTVDRLGLAQGIQAIAADLSGL